MYKNLDKIKSLLSSRLLVFEKGGIYRLVLNIDDVAPYLDYKYWIVDLKVIEYQYSIELDGVPTMVDALLVPVQSIENLFHNRILDELYDILKHYGITSFSYRLSR
jgi:hypothetical protein